MKKTPHHFLLVHFMTTLSPLICRRDLGLLIPHGGYPGGVENPFKLRLDVIPDARGSLEFFDPLVSLNDLIVVELDRIVKPGGSFYEKRKDVSCCLPREL